VVHVTLTLMVIFPLFLFSFSSVIKIQTHRDSCVISSYLVALLSHARCAPLAYKRSTVSIGLRLTLTCLFAQQPIALLAAVAPSKRYSSNDICLRTVL
jgi:hypothetical protein